MQIAKQTARLLLIVGFVWYWFVKATAVRFVLVKRIGDACFGYSICLNQNLQALITNNHTLGNGSETAF